MKKTAEQPQLSKKLVLHKETLRLLTNVELRQVGGGNSPREPNSLTWYEEPLCPGLPAGK